MKLSVIIVNYNVEHFLDHCLHSVFKALQGIPGEVFVVDNNSVDGSLEMVRRKYGSVKLIANDSNKGFSKANNQAIQKATGEYVLLLNPDTVVEEDTFRNVLAFMDAHPDSGGVGVRMIDGKGNFLPESKRSLPTPAVAFYKIFGLSALFPRSATFGKYHLGHLSPDENHEVEILSGAFMCIRKQVLDRIGGLDEQFFMYGEDIDLSYRILKAGYRNYYFSGTRIIHYKGESTKKSSVNYVLVFYQAMILFARKHFSSGRANLFTFLINCAVYLRAFLAIFVRLLRSLSLPVMDVTGGFLGIWFIKEYYEEHFKYTEGGAYPPEFMQYIVPGYLLLWLLSVFFSGGYDRPLRLTRLIRGVLIGSALILVVYALLPESLRFSRVMIFLGAGWVLVWMLMVRLTLHISGIHRFRLDGNPLKRLAIIGTAVECNRVEKVVRDSGVTLSFCAHVNVKEEKTPDFAGTLSQIGEICTIYKIDELIFCSRDMSAQEIMDLMVRPPAPDLEFKIAPPESLSVIGSNSIDSAGDLYVIGTNAISKPVNRRNKRLIDVISSMVLTILAPLLAWFTNNPAGFVKNIFMVLFGKKTWIGFHKVEIPATQSVHGAAKLPPLRPGVLSPADAVRLSTSDPETLSRLNSLYARDYRPWNDLSILLRSWRLLGK